MSVRVMQAVWQHSRQSGGALVLLLAIADNAHDDGDGAYPSIETLAKKARMTGRNVNLLLKHLQACGEIAISPGAGPRGCNVYRVCLPDLATPENPSPLKSFHPEKSDTEGVKFPARGGEISGKKGVKPASPKPLVNHQEKPSREPSAARAPRRASKYPLPDDFPLTCERRDWLAANCPDLDPERAHAEFCSYWRSVSGEAKGLKSDWQATWENGMYRSRMTRRSGPDAPNNGTVRMFGAAARVMARRQDGPTTAHATPGEERRPLPHGAHRTAD